MILFSKGSSVRSKHNKRDGRAVDQERQAGCEDDAAELPPVPVQRGAAVADPFVGRWRYSA